MKEKDFYQYPNTEKKNVNKIIINLLFFLLSPLLKKKSIWSEIIFILLQCSLSKIHNNNENNDEKYTRKEKEERNSINNIKIQFKSLKIKFIVVH